MSLTALPMLDFSLLNTPSGHGEVLVSPDAGAWGELACDNHAALGAADSPLLDSNITEWRRRARACVVGDSDALVFVLGHQPEFIHPGVWAKHVAVVRAAKALGGVALNIVVDNDAPNRGDILVPQVDGGEVSVKAVPYAKLVAGRAFEQLPLHSADEWQSFEQGVRSAMGERFDASLMPIFFQGIQQADDPRDWVDQAVAGRRAVEKSMGITLDDRRISDVWCSPLLLDMLANAERFAASYNNALAQYRREYRVRGAQRPIADLAIEGDRCELPVWAYRMGEARQRLFVSKRGSTYHLFAGDVSLGEVPVDHVRSCEDLGRVLSDVEGWRLRPRALTLTIWARLLLADLFVHGIGGAKYDRISDTIIADYYGLTPPHMACVSATLLMDLPDAGARFEDVSEIRRAMRDLRLNPQRGNLQRGTSSDPKVDQLIAARAAAVARSESLAKLDRRNRSARRDVFDEIRKISGEIVGLCPGAEADVRAKLELAVDAQQAHRVASGREYFFGLYDRSRLELLLQRLPAEQDFRV